MVYMLGIFVALVIGVPEANALLKNESHVGNDEVQDGVTVVTDGLDENSFVLDEELEMFNSTRNRLNTIYHHRSGVRFPDDLLDRFQLDLAGQKTFRTKCENSWGPSRPKMSRVRRYVSVHRKLIQSAAMFWDTVSAKGALVYAHHYHPDWKGSNGEYGIDCSNFVAHVYNLVSGVTFTSSITELAKLNLPHVTKWGDLQPGDVVLFQNWARTKVSHTGIAVEGKGNPSVVHSTGGDRSGPQLSSSHNWWPIARFAYGFRLTDLLGCKDPNCVGQATKCHKTLLLGGAELLV